MGAVTRSARREPPGSLVQELGRASEKLVVVVVVVFVPAHEAGKRYCSSEEHIGGGGLECGKHHVRGWTWGLVVSL